MPDGMPDRMPDDRAARPRGGANVKPADLLPMLKTLHARIRDAVIAACETQSLERLAHVERDGEGDTVFAIDAIGEALLVDLVASEIAVHAPVVLIAEGLEGGPLVLPRGTSEADAPLRLIVDPIDGSRGLMYQKRPAWILTGVAPNRGADTCLADIELALMTEIPLVKQHLCDVFWAERGRGARAERIDRFSGRRTPLRLRPSQASSLAHGFAQVSRFFPGARELLAAIDDDVCRRVLGPVRPGKAQCFEDQYLSSAGQLHELIVGHDRFVADLRPLVEENLRHRGVELGICAHPYDLCTELIAREAGVIVCKPGGGPLDARLALEPDVAWVGYANEAIRGLVEPALQAALRERGIATEPGARGGV